MRSALDKLGRLELPKTIRDALDLRSGDALEIEESAGCIVLRPITERSSIAQKGGVLLVSSTPVGDLAEAIWQHREARLRTAAAQERDDDGGESATSGIIR